MAQVVGIFLIATLLLVHFSTRAAPMPSTRPLDVDEVLFPALGQASTVFSLTALFGAYYGMFLVLGTYAIGGVAAGSIAALVMIRRAALEAEEKRYESFLYNRMSKFTDPEALTGPIGVVQLLFAVSELVILRAVLVVAFSIPDIYATVTVMLIATIGYTYCLLGGYNAVFRTDVVQLVTIIVMCFVLIGQLIAHGTDVAAPAVISRLLGVHPGFWYADALPSRTFSHVLDFAIGFPMGLMFLLASPDTWKRVFIVSKRDPHVRSLFVLFAAGAFPFLLIAPLVITAPALKPGPINPLFILENASTNAVVMGCTLLGLTGSFLSAFNSAFISASHIGILQARRWTTTVDEIVRFRYVAGVLFVALSALALLLLRSPNPYSLANVLHGPYAIAGATVLGLRGGKKKVSTRFLMAVWSIAVLLWSAYLSAKFDTWYVATTEEANTIPLGVLLFLLVLTAFEVRQLASKRKHD